MSKLRINWKNTKKEEFIEIEIANLKRDSWFALLDESIQREIIANLHKISKRKNDEITRYFTPDQLAIYFIFGCLVAFLVLNVFLKYVNIPFLIYFFFYLVIIWTFFLIVISKRKERIKEIWNMASGWDEIPKPARSDFVEIVKNEIEVSHMSLVWRIMYGKIIKYIIYLILFIFIVQTFIQDWYLTSRLFLVASLSILILFIMMIPVSIVDEISGDKKITHKDFLCVYLISLNVSYKKLILTIISFLFLLLIYAFSHFSGYIRF
ncbi:MAG: hypothetical protein ACD_2C00184G0008 [uncultured bacterium (gcode 4)]|uniref:Uncharacterized protein n=1 Tax=uncultured bacterium (gcode 4) TaxID=1234023 RepID=K2FE01_9BACT|nr:MAG: hypothetical protein ACD_2C00184G0008 [uncultured bacterium (gcode 4)]